MYLSKKVHHSGRNQHLTSTQDYDRLGRKAVFLVLLYFLMHLRLFPFSQWIPCLGFMRKKKWGNVIVK